METVRRPWNAPPMETSDPAGEVASGASTDAAPSAKQPDDGVARAAAAAAALELVRPGMTIGLGSGRAVFKLVELLGARGEPVRAAVASEATRERALAAGIEIVELDGTVELDLALDGADEVDPELRLIKGGGGALLREKIVISAARRFVVVAETPKLVPRLGTGFRLPVEIVALRLARHAPAARRAASGRTAARGRRRRAVPHRRGAPDPGLRAARDAPTSTDSRSTWSWCRAWSSTACSSGLPSARCSGGPTAASTCWGRWPPARSVRLCSQGTGPDFQRPLRRRSPGGRSSSRTSRREALSRREVDRLARGHAQGRDAVAARRLVDRVARIDRLRRRAAGRAARRPRAPSACCRLHRSPSTRARPPARPARRRRAHRRRPRRLRARARRDAAPCRRRGRRPRRAASR